MVTFLAQPLALYAFSIICLLVWAFLLWNNSRAQTLKRNLLKGVLTTLALACIWLMGAKPAVQKEMAGDVVLLLTAGTAPSSLDSLQNQVQPDYTFRMFEDSLFDEIPFKPSLSAIQAAYPHIKKWHIAGYGLKKHELKHLQGQAVAFYPAALPQGVSEVFHSEHLTLGDTLFVEGEYHHNKAGPVWLKLEQAGVSLDSVLFKTPGQHQFSLKARPKTTGNQLFNLRASQNGIEGKANPLPVDVSQPELLEVMVLQSSPDFESRYLKKWLSKQGHSLIWRSKVSKERYHDDFINCKPLALNRLNEVLLSKIDLLILDHNSYQGLTSREKKYVRNSIEQKGLGLLLLADEEILEKKADFIGVGWKKTVRSDDPEFSDDSKLTVPDFEFEKKGLLYPVYKQNGSWLAAAKPTGQGTIGFVMPVKTYALSLKGKDLAYDEFWSHLIQQIARKKKRPFHVMSGEKAFAGEYWRAKLLITEDLPVLKLPSGNEKELQATSIPGRKNAYQLRLMPAESGWYSFESDSLSIHRFVNEDSAWEVLQMSDRKEVNLNFVKKNNQQTSRFDTHFSQAVPIGLIWFYVVFVLVMSVLWIESKF